MDRTIITLNEELLEMFIKSVINFVIIVTIIVIAILAVVYFAFALSFWFERRGCQTISYNQFIKLYSIAPNKWEIWNGCVVYYDDASGSTFIYMRSYFDAIRLYIMACNRNKKALDMKLNEKRSELLKLWQKDINAYHDSYLNDIKVYLKEGKIL